MVYTYLAYNAAVDIDQNKLMSSILVRLKMLRYRTVSGALRREAISQSRLAELIGESRMAVANIENGRQQLPILLLYKICKALDVELMDILPSVSEVTDGSHASADDAVVLEWAGEKHSLPPEDVDFARAVEELKKLRRGEP